MTVSNAYLKPEVLASITRLGLRAQRVVEALVQGQVDVAHLGGFTFVTKGTGALVMYSATATAMPSPITSPRMKPSSVPPDWRRKAGVVIGVSVLAAVTGIRTGALA